MHKELEAWKNKGQFLTYKGQEIFYIREGSGEELLLLHGYPYNSFEWKTCMEELVKKYTVTIFDLPGLGFSDKSRKGTYSYQAYTDLVSFILAYLGIRKVHIWAHDLGVSVAQELIARNIQKQDDFLISSSAFMNGGLFMDVYRPRMIQRLLSQSPGFIGALLSRMIGKKSVNSSVKKLFGPDTQPTNDFLDLQWEVLNDNNGKSITYLIGRMVFEKYRYQQRWIRAMQETAIPLCYICGPWDPNSGRHMANRYKELIPSPRIYFLDDKIGHWPQLEAPVATLELYDTFRNTL